MNTSQLRGAPGWAALFVCLFFARPAVAEQPYLDDANPRRAAIDGSLPNLHADFPRVLTHELQSGVTPEEYSKYQFITTKGDDFPIIEKVQHNFSPGTKMLRHISARAYQPFNFPLQHLRRPGLRNYDEQEPGRPERRLWHLRRALDVSRRHAAAACRRRTNDGSRAAPTHSTGVRRHLRCAGRFLQAMPNTRRSRP